jgi:hypothetical protein
MEAGGRCDRHHVAFDREEHALVFGEPWNAKLLSYGGCPIRIRIAGRDDPEAVHAADRIDVIPADPPATGKRDAEDPGVVSHHPP